MPDKKKKPPRFHDLQVGDWLVQRLGSGDHEMELLHRVTDFWFDPCRGQRREESGRMVAVAPFCGVSMETGEVLLGMKWPHTRQGLVSNRFRYATLEEGHMRVKAFTDRWTALHGPKVVLLRDRRPRAEPQGKRPL